MNQSFYASFLYPLQHIAATFRRGMYRCAYAVALFSLLCLLPAHAACPNKPLAWGWVTWAPFIYQDDQKKFTGLDHEIVSRVLAQTACQWTMSENQIPWRRQLAWIEVGELDLISGAAKTTEREKYAYFSAPYRSESVTIFVRKADREKFKIKQLDDLNLIDFRGLGYNKGTYYGMEFNQLQDNAKFSALLQSDLEINNFKRLLSNRLDGVIVDEIAGQQFLQQLGETDTIVPLADFRITTGDIHVMFSKQSVSPDMVELFNNELVKLKASQTYQAILDKYSGEK